MNTVGNSSGNQKNDSKSFSNMPEDSDNRAQVKKLFDNLKDELPTLEKLLGQCNDHWGYEDGIYRFYHQSYKVYSVQDITMDIVDSLKAMSPSLSLNDWFMRIIHEGTGKTASIEDNNNWLAIVRPILEAFFHAKFFLEMAVKYGKGLEYPPNIMPSGWAAFLYLYNLR